MRDLSFTVYTKAADTRGQVKTQSWKKWLKVFREHAEREDKDGPAVVLGPVDGKRAKGNVREVHALSVDVEHQPDSKVSAALAALAPFAYAAYTTHRHGTEPTCRLRVVVPLARPIAPADQPSAWQRMNMLVGGINDPSTKDAGRLNYLPSCRPGAERDAFAGSSDRWLSADDLPPLLRVVADSADVAEGVAAIRHRLLSLPHAHALKKIGRALIEGHSFAEPKHRHQAILDTTWWVAASVKGPPPAEAVEELFRESLEAMDTDQTLADVRAAYEGALAKRREKKRAAQLQGQEPYTDAELAAIAREQGTDAEGLRKRWIVQRDSTYYFLTPQGYSRAYSYREGQIAAVQHLARAPVELSDETPRGDVPRSIDKLALLYGLPSRDHVVDLTIQRSTFDGETFCEAGCPRRALEPAEDPLVAEWLEVLGGPSHEKLLDWLACVPDLSRLLSALYLAGESGGGKSLLACGLASIWSKTGSPTEIEAVLAENNEELTQCPLVFADEAVPRKHRGNPTTTALRSMISSLSRTLRRKYRAPMVLRGALRLVLTANNEFLLADEDESPGAHDRDAVAKRFLYVEVGKKAAKFVRELESKVHIHREWVEGGAIARHVLWLAETREVEQEGRFWVQGLETAMSRQLATGGSVWNKWVCEWLVRYLMNPKTHDAKGDGRIRRGNGELLVNAAAIVDGWQLYMQIRRDPDTSRVGEALSAISLGGKKIQRAWRGVRIWYHRVNVEVLADWSSRIGIGDAEEMRKLVNERVGADEQADVPSANRRPI